MQSDVKWIEMEMTNGGRPYGRVRYDFNDQQAVGDRMLFGLTEAEFNGEPGTPLARMTIKVENGVPIIREVAFVATEGARGVTASDLRAMAANLDAMREIALTQHPFQSLGPDGTLTMLGTGEVETAKTHAALNLVPRPRRITPEFLAQVAQVYRDTVKANGSPIPAIMAAFNVEQRTAAGYAQRATKAGLLPATTRGRKRI